MDRIVDYATALESTLVWEKDYTTRRMRRRPAALIASRDLVEMKRVVGLMKRFYEIRSRIVHGSSLGDENREWLLNNESENWRQVELCVRQVLVTAVRKFPLAEGERRAALTGLYDPTDEDRGSLVIEKFKEIKTDSVRKARGRVK